MCNFAQSNVQIGGLSLWKMANKMRLSEVLPPTKEALLRHFIETCPDTVERFILGKLEPRIKLPCIGSFGLVQYAYTVADVENMIAQMMAPRS